LFVPETGHQLNGREMSGLFCLRDAVSLVYDKLQASEIARGARHAALLGLRDTVQGGPKSKPLPNYQKIVLDRIKLCLWDRFLRQIKEMIKYYNIIRPY